MLTKTQAWISAMVIFVVGAGIAVTGWVTGNNAMADAGSSMAMLAIGVLIPYKAA